MLWRKLLFGNGEVVEEEYFLSSLEICKIFLFFFIKLSEKENGFQIPGIPVIVYLGVFLLSDREPRFYLCFLIKRKWPLMFGSILTVSGSV